MKIKKILWPTDFSPASYKALETVQEFARKFGAELYVINIVPPVPVSYGTTGVGGFDVPLYLEEIQKSNIKKLKETIEEKIDKKIKSHPIVLKGPEVDGILKAADENDVDLIVVSTHGYTGIKRLFLGSVAEGITRHAKQPVLTIRVTEEDTE